MLVFKYCWVFCLLPLISGLNFAFSSRRPHLSEQIQIDPDGYFDIIERPEQFLEIDKQIVSFKFIENKKHNY